MQRWVEVVENTQQTEPFVPVYMCLSDRSSALRVRMFEVYDDEAAFAKHCGTELLQKRIADEERLRPSDPEVVFLKKVGGFLHKAKSNI